VLDVTTDAAAVEGRASGKRCGRNALPLTGEDREMEFRGWMNVPGR
jgi:hypothetical protein